MTKIPETRQLKQKTIFLAVLKGEKPNIKALADLAFVEDLLPGSLMVRFLLCPPHEEKGERSF